MAAIDWATANGMRWMKVVSKDRGQRRYGGELRSYYNYGINGSGAVETYALRPGWHAGSLPTMRQIGKGPNKNLRDNRFVWVEGEVAADVDYQGEADANPDKDIPDRIPEDGYYLKATNADKAKSQADRVGWFVSGAFKANRIISDAEARRVIDQWNAEHPGQKVEYDYEREGGVEFSEADAARVNGGGEKATTIERSGAVSGNSSDGGLLEESSARQSHSPLTSPEDAAKVRRKTEITLSSAKKIQNEGGLKAQIDTPAQAIRAIGNGLHLDRSKSSQSYYGDVHEGDIMVDGRLLHLRVSNHEANGARMGNANADHKVSLVIRKNGEHVSTGEHDGYTEWVFEPSEVSPKDAANAIIGGVESLIRTGEFVDATGKAHRKDYPYTDNDGVVHYRVRRAPNGKESRLDERQYDEVRTDNFKKWFGDWENDPENASKVVDENGEPLVVWHGTDNDFFTFDRGRLGENTDFNADEIVGQSAHIGFWFNRGGEEMLDMTYGKRMPVYLDIKEPVEFTSLRALSDEIAMRGGAERFIDDMRDAGHDGVVVKDEEFGGTSYVAFEPSQIKSATENNGDFSRESGDIRFRFVGERGAGRQDAADGGERMRNKEIAEAMEHGDKDARSIKLATGWERAARTASGGTRRGRTASCRSERLAEWRCAPP